MTIKWRASRVQDTVKHERSAGSKVSIRTTYPMMRSFPDGCTIRGDNAKRISDDTSTWVFFPLPPTAERLFTVTNHTTGDRRRGAACTWWAVPSTDSTVAVTVVVVVVVTVKCKRWRRRQTVVFVVFCGGGLCGRRRRRRRLYSYNLLPPL